MEDVNRLLDWIGPIADDPRKRALDLVATPSAWPRRWACPGVYRLRVVDESSRFYGMEYVGMSTNVRKRVMDHISCVDGSDRKWGCFDAATPAPLRRHMEGRALSLFPGGIARRDLAFVEYHWICLLKPALNGHTPIPRRYSRRQETH
jgi:hypothetical protein